MARELLPNSTQIPDVILDFWLSALTGAELKVVLYIARRTYGFGKKSDTISLNQMSDGIRKRDGTELDRGTGLSRSTVKTVCNTLVTRGILLKQNNMSSRTGEYEESTYQLNLDAEISFDEDGGSGSGEEGVGQKSTHVGQKSSPKVGRESAQGRPKTIRGVGRFSALQETDQDTDQQETATAGMGTAVADLEMELRDLGMNPRDAKRLSIEKPTECRKQMSYLAFHNPPRRNPGGWLVEAVEGEYAPPPKFLDEERKSKKLAVVVTSKASQSDEDSRRAFLWSRYVSYLRLSVDRVTTSQPRALAEFEEWEAKEKLKYTKLGLSTRHFDDEGERLKRFADFFGKARPGDTWSFDQWRLSETEEQAVSVSP